MNPPALTGPAGAGKTRLMIEWCARMRERGWLAGFVEGHPDVAPATEGENRVPATIERFVYLGSTTQVFVALPGGDRVQALVANSGDVEEYDVGAAVTAHLPADALRILADDEAVTA